MSRRRVLLLALALGILWAPSSSGAQQRPQVPRIGFLCWTICGGPHHEAFWQALRELGWVDYKNFRSESRGAGGDEAALRIVAAELARLEVSVIVADTTLTALAAKNATRTIPIVAIADDPVGSGLVASLARPGGNVTGLSSVTPELSVKRLELLKEAVPRASRVAVLWNPAIPAITRGLKEMEAAARALGVTVQVREARTLMELDRALAAMTEERVQALVAFTDSRTLYQPELIVGRVAKSRLPAMYDHGILAAAGGLMAYGPSVSDLYRRAATYVDRILKGAKPADLPVEQPTKFELVINLKTAKALGLTIPRSILLRADRVIQ